jgi:hypothetical protein
VLAFFAALSLLGRPWPWPRRAPDTAVAARP